jgi:hypothetical protein
MKMNKNTYIVMAVILVVLLGVWFLLQHKQEKQVITKQDMIDIIPKDFPSDKITKIEMTKGTDKFVLEKRDSIWYVPTCFDYKAEQNKFGNLLKELNGIKASIREKDSKILDDYELGDKTAIFVTLTAAGNRVIKFMLGKRDPNVNESFVRISENKDVLIANKDLHQLFNVFGDNKIPESKSWVDHKANSFEQATLKRAVAHVGKDEIVIERVSVTEKDQEEPADEEGGKKKIKKVKEGKWELISPKVTPVDEQKVASFVSALSSIYSNDICEPGKEKEYGLDPQENYIVLEFDNGKTLKYIYGKMQNENNSYFKIEGKKEIYAINEYSRNMAMRQAADYKKEEKKPENQQGMNKNEDQGQEKIEKPVAKKPDKSKDKKKK